MDEAGAPTASATRLRQASTDEYPTVLAEIIRSAYQKVFELVDPAQDTDVAIADPYPRTPAMAAGIADHVWTCEEIAALLD